MTCTEFLLATLTGDGDGDGDGERSALADDLGRGLLLGDESGFEDKLRQPVGGLAA